MAPVAKSKRRVIHHPVCGRPGGVPRRGCARLRAICDMGDMGSMGVMGSSGSGRVIVSNGPEITTATLSSGHSMRDHGSRRRRRSVPLGHVCR